MKSPDEISSSERGKDPQLSLFSDNAEDMSQGLLFVINVRYRTLIQVCMLLRISISSPTMVWFLYRRPLSATAKEII